uniref:Uncharacterized protein n=1 Tax=Opuntia streptacantha TaxID=393608 RepID=A0A7C9DCP5_OPUST
MANDQDFTFPISDPTNSPIDSPPLWRLSPAASPTPSHSQQTPSSKLVDFHISQTENMAINYGGGTQRKSCSSVEGGGLLRRLRMGCGENDQDEEKMDMLWEDLNEEVTRKDRISKRTFNLHDYSRGGQNKLMELGCVPTSFRLVKNNDYDHNKKVVKNGKKPSVVLLMKAFRKLFLLHHSQQSSAKKRS